MALKRRVAAGPRQPGGVCAVGDCDIRQRRLCQVCACSAKCGDQERGPWAASVVMEALLRQAKAGAAAPAVLEQLATAARVAGRTGSDKCVCCARHAARCGASPPDGGRRSHHIPSDLIAFAELCSFSWWSACSWRRSSPKQVCPDVQTRWGSPPSQRLLLCIARFALVKQSFHQACACDMSPMQL
jgi:hypothetical protein